MENALQAPADLTILPRSVDLKAPAELRQLKVGGATPAAHCLSPSQLPLRGDVYLSTYLSICLFTLLSICLFVALSICLFVVLFFCLSSIHPPICLSLPLCEVVIQQSFSVLALLHAYMIHICMHMPVCHMLYR